MQIGWKRWAVERDIQLTLAAITGVASGKESATSAVGVKGGKKKIGGLDVMEPFFKKESRNVRRESVPAEGGGD